MTSSILQPTQSESDYIKELQTKIEDAYNRKDFVECMTLRTLQEYYTDKETIVLDDSEAQFVYTFNII